MTESSASRFDLIDAMRGRWERRAVLTAESLQAYVEGFADAKGFEPDDTWERVSRWVHEYLGVKPEVQWHWAEQIARNARSYASQIPLFYGAIDQAFGRRCMERWCWRTSESWRSRFDLRQREFHTLRPDMVFYAPHSLTIERSGESVWRLYQLDAAGLRMSEKSDETLEGLKIWSSENRFLLIPEDAWTLDPMVE